jgi:hypothetical protein
MHLMITSNTYGPLATHPSGVAPLIFDSHALIAEPGARSCAPFSSPVALNVSLRKEK